MQPPPKKKRYPVSHQNFEQTEGVFDRNDNFNSEKQNIDEFEYFPKNNV